MAAHACRALLLLACALAPAGAMASGGAVANPRVVLLSHGTRQPSAWAQLERVARSVGSGAGVAVTPASVFFGRSASDPTDGGSAQPPLALDAALEQLCAAAPDTDVFLLPFILGPSRALREATPSAVRELASGGAVDAARVHVGPSLSEALDGAGIDVLANALSAEVERALELSGFRQPLVCVCDHGSADARVARVRRELAERMRARLGGRVLDVVPAPMERPASLPPGSAADDPLLEERLGAPGTHAQAAIVAMAFHSPGRHAGPDGDVAQIVRAATDARPGLRVHTTGLLGDCAAVEQELLAAQARAWVLRTQRLRSGQAHADID